MTIQVVKAVRSPFLRRVDEARRSGAGA